MPKANCVPTTGATGTLAEESTGLASPVRDFPHTRRRLLAGAASGVAAATVAALPAVAVTAEVPQIDPHPAWWAEHQRLVEFIDTPGRDQAAVDAAFEREGELEGLIAETPAATLAGVRAQVAFVHRSLDVVSSFNELDVEALENALATLDRLAGGAAPPVALPHPDAALLALAPAMKAAKAAEVAIFDAYGPLHMTDEQEAACDEATTATNATAARVAPLPALTLDGLRLKARAYMIAIGDRDLADDPHDCACDRILYSLLRDLLPGRAAA